MRDAGIRIRGAEPADVSALAVLCTELGYPCSSADMGRRLSHILARGDHAVFVAEHDEAGVIGWVHALRSDYLERDPQAEIGGLVVSAAHQGHGAGRLLMQEAERWAADQGMEAVFLRSNVVRKGAHAFYHRIGYETVKTSLTLRKILR